MESTRNGKLLQLVNRLVEDRIAVFVYMCLVVHVFYALLFHFHGILPCVILNIFSALVYTYIGFIRRAFTENDMVACYFEILIFSAISTVLLGPGDGFDMFIFGMASVLSLFIPSKGNIRYLYMLIGFLMLPAAHVLASHPLFAFCNAYRQAYAPYQTVTFYINFVISAITVMGSIFFFSKNTRDQLNHLHILSSTDSLTGLRNRRSLESAVAYLREDYALAMLDIDDFKQVNDVYGHQVGDVVLQRVAAVILGNVRANDIAARWGGEEFVLCLAKCPIEPAMRIVEAIRADIEALEFEEEPQLRLTITIGLTSRRARALEDVVHDADEALYEGKRSGKNRVVLHAE